MDDDGDLALLPELLDRSFGAGPEGLPTPAARLAVGRRALRRRRRLQVAATSLAVVAAVGVGAAVSGHGGTRGADGPPPALTTSGTSPSPTASDSPSAQQQRALERQARKAAERAHRLEQQSVSAMFPAAFGSGGTVIVKDGWRITQRVENPMGHQPPESSLGVVVTNGDQTRWMLLEHQLAEDEQGHPLPNAFGDSASADDAGKGYSRFEDWLASMVELQGGARTPPLVTVGDDDTVQPGPGATVVDVREMPVVAGSTTAGDRMAEVRRDGRTWFVVLRGHGSDAEVIPVDADVLPEPTFAAFLDHVRTQNASGEGLR